MTPLPTRSAPPRPEDCDPVISSCPVCFRPDPVDAAVCEDCGWTLRGPLLLGPVTRPRREAFDALFATARRNVDLRAAALAAGYPDGGDPHLLDRLLTLLRGSAEEPARRQDAVGAVAHLARPRRSKDYGDPHALIHDAVERLADALEAGVGTALGQRITVAEIGVTGIATVQFVPDDEGLIAPGDLVHVPWRALCPSLPADPDAALLCLAAGLAVTAEGRQQLLHELADVRDASTLSGHLADPGCEILLLLRAPHWYVPARFTRSYCERLRREGPRTRLTVVDDVPFAGRPLDGTHLDEVLRRVRLRTEYGIALAAVRPHDRTVSLSVHPLFRPGDSAASCVPVDLRIRGTATGGRPCLLALMVTDGVGTDRVQWRPFRVASVVLRAGVEYQLTASLDRPGVVRYRCVEVDSGAAAPAEDRTDLATFATARHHLPARYEEQSAALSLMIAIEQAGSPAELAQRLAVARELLELIDREHPDQTAVRCGLLTYDDHREGTGVVVRGVLQRSARAVLAELDKIEARPVESRFAAPVEDVLFQTAGSSWGAGPGRRVLVLIGSRMPHPKQHDGDLPPCPHRRDWRVSLRHLTDKKVQVVTVWQEPTWVGRPDHKSRAARARQEWRQLGGTAPIPLSRQAARNAALATQAIPPRNDRPLLFPITVPPR